MVAESEAVTGLKGFVPHDAVLRVRTMDDYIGLMTEQSQLVASPYLEDRSYNHLVTIGVLSADMKRGIHYKKGQPQGCP